MVSRRISLSLFLLACAWPVTAPGGVSAAPPPTAALLAKLDSRLVATLAAGASEDVPVWIELADKGETGPADLAAHLARARDALTEGSLRRRLRAGVSPLVDYRDLPVHEPYLEQMRALGLRPYGASRWLNRAAVRAPATAWQGLAALPFVARISPVDRVRVSADPIARPTPALPPRLGTQSTQANPADYGPTWDQLDQVQLPALHDSGYIGTGVLICMLDDGFYAYRNHEALKPIPVAPGRARDFVEGDTDVANDAGCEGCTAHGASTLGVVGGRKPGSYLGAAYGASFALGRTEYDLSEHVIEMVYWAQAAEWADSLGADIISCSLGYSSFDAPDPDYTYADMNGRTTLVTLAAVVAAEKGILVVTSAGNEGISSWRYVVAPGDVNGDSALTVGAVHPSGLIANFSSRGPTSDGRIKPDVVAFGVGAAVPDVNDLPDGYTTLSGTSFSTPIVAGVAACLLQAHPDWSPVQLAQAIRFTADRAANPDNDYGYGLVRATAAHAYPVNVWTGAAPDPKLALRGPNPFRAGAQATAFGFYLGAGSSSAKLTIHDALGRRVRTLWSGSEWLGGPVSWDGRGDDREVVPSGVYWAVLSSGGRRSSLRIVALR
jgi:subtilisin family serine protease